MDALALFALILNAVLLVLVFAVGFAVLRLVKMKELEHELTFGDPDAVEDLRRKHAARISKAGVRQAVMQTTASQRP